MPGLFLTCLFSAPYLADAVRSFPRSAGHDVVLGIVIALLWGTYFCWDRIRRHFPRVYEAILRVLGILTVTAIVALYGTVIDLIVSR